MPNLFFFTQHYPFRPGAETFIENEIGVAAEFFDHIYIFPMMQDGDMRILQKNAIVVNPPFKTKGDILKRGLLGMKPKVLVRILKEAVKLKIWVNKNLLRSFLAQSLEFAALLNSSQLKEVTKLIKPGDILYSYWGIGWANVIPFYKPLKNKFVSRFHGGDLYFERGGALLFRHELLSCLSKSFFISEQGMSYQHSRFPNLNFLSEVSYLGTLDNGVSEKSHDGKLRIVSCSHIVPLKRVELIFKSLLLYNNQDVEWTHIGGRGEGLESLKKLVETSPHNFKVTLTGELANFKVMEYFRKHPVDCFINVSSTEGLPVSIMEAISFGVPVIATDVGGTSEIVNSNTGILLSSDPSEQEIVNAIKRVRKEQFLPRDFWLSNFEATKNYKKFYKDLLSSDY